MRSKIERGQLCPTLPTLLRIALVFSVGLDYFFSGTRDKPTLGIVRRMIGCDFPRKLGHAMSPTSSNRWTILRSSAG